MDWLADLLGLNRGKATTAAADQNKTLLSGLEGKVGGLIDAGTEKQAGLLGDSLGLVDLGAGGQGILRDVLGLGGDEGKARAMQAFQGSNPGYQFQMDQGLDALDRRAASRGMLSSGNTSLDTLNYSQGLADQSFGDWFNRLMGGVDRETAARGDLATLYGQDTGQRIGLAEGIGNATMAQNLQGAAGKEAGQGWLLNLLDSAAGAVGAFTGFGKGGASPSLGGMSGGVKTGYGAGFR